MHQLDSQFCSPGFEFHSDLYLDLFHSSPESKSSATLVIIQLICFQPVGILNNVMLDLTYMTVLFCFSCLLATSRYVINILKAIDNCYNLLLVPV